MPVFEYILYSILFSVLTLTSHADMLNTLNISSHLHNVTLRPDTVTNTEFASFPFYILLHSLCVVCFLLIAFALGFTSSTGGAWQKHDILSWFVCEDPEVCGFRLDDRLFDYHSESKSYTYKFA